MPLEPRNQRRGWGSLAAGGDLAELRPLGQVRSAPPPPQAPPIAEHAGHAPVPSYSEAWVGGNDRPAHPRRGHVGIGRGRL
eukprot:7218923-Alexandrium_andersonii.AAC.1